jgi:hypothetical protein
LKTARERMDIIAAYREVGSYRGAAEMCATTPKTVRRVVERHQAGGQRPERKPRERNYDRVVELVGSRVQATKGRISAKRLLPAARTAGYAGSARNFRRLVAAEKRAWRADHHRGRRPAVWTPGEMLVIDWGSQGGLHLFCAVLAGAVTGSYGSPPMSGRRRPWRCWRSVSRSWAGCRRWCSPTGWRV